MKYQHLAARVFDTPLLISRPKLKAVLSVLGPRLGFDLSRGEAPPAARIYAEDHDEETANGPSATAGLYVLEGGVARIPVFGTLVHRCSGISALSGMTSYVGLSGSLQAALADDNAHAVLLEVDSPGGEAGGAFDFADEIYAGRQIKPIWAIANDWADSGGYLIASAADRVIITQTGEAGSVGVAWCHVDYSEQNKMLGEAVTYLHAGARKIDGNPDNPLSKEAREIFQADIDAVYSLFVQSVARNRGLDEDAVRATEAGIFRAADAIKIGFADEIGTLRDTLETLAGEVSPSVLIPGTAFRAIGATTQMERSMTNKPSAPAGDPAVSKPDIETVDTASIRQEATTAAITAERARVGAILSCDEAKGREELARELAFQTEMSAGAAKKILAKAPVAQAAVTTEKQPNVLEAAMGKVANPAVGADGAHDKTEEQQASDLATRIVSAYRGPSSEKHH